MGIRYVEVAAVSIDILNLYFKNFIQAVQNS